MTTLGNWFQSQGADDVFAQRAQPWEQAGLTGEQWARRGYNRQMNKLYDKSPMAKRFMDWGWRGVGQTAYEGAAFSGGFWRGAGGKMQLFGGMPKGRVALGSLTGLGVGAAVYAATDNPLLGVAAGVGATHFTKMGISTGAKMLGPAFVGLAMYEGYKEGGLGGAIGAGVKEAAIFAAFDVGIKGIGVAFKGTALHTVGSAALSVVKPLALVAGLGYGAYKGATYLRGLGRRARRTEFVGDMTAFSTRSAHSQRQRALQEISRSHTNARTLLGNEAQLMHL